LQASAECRSRRPVRTKSSRSIRKLAGLNPAMILSGSGPPVTDMAAFERFVSRLPA
jgi:hypothetical protein